MEMIQIINLQHYKFHLGGLPVALRLQTHEEVLKQLDAQMAWIMRNRPNVKVHDLIVIYNNHLDISIMRPVNVYTKHTSMSKGLIVCEKVEIYNYKHLPHMQAKWESQILEK
nr:hypothetical protein MmNV_10 [Menippe mercenaria nudivirus]